MEVAGEVFLSLPFLQKLDNLARGKGGVPGKLSGSHPKGGHLLQPMSDELSTEHRQEWIH